MKDYQTNPVALQTVVNQLYQHLGEISIDSLAEVHTELQALEMKHLDKADSTPRGDNEWHASRIVGALFLLVNQVGFEISSEAPSTPASNEDGEMNPESALAELRADNQAILEEMHQHPDS